MTVLALEEHFVTPEALHAGQSLDKQWQTGAKIFIGGRRRRRLLELGVTDSQPWTKRH